MLARKHSNTDYVVTLRTLNVIRRRSQTSWFEPRYLFSYDGICHRRGIQYMTFKSIRLPIKNFDSIITIKIHYQEAVIAPSSPDPTALSQKTTFIKTQGLDSSHRSQKPCLARSEAPDRANNRGTCNAWAHADESPRQTLGNTTNLQPTAWLHPS